MKLEVTSRSHPKLDVRLRRQLELQGLILSSENQSEVIVHFYNEMAKLTDGPKALEI